MIWRVFPLLIAVVALFIGHSCKSASKELSRQENSASDQWLKDLEQYIDSVEIEEEDTPPTALDRRTDARMDQNDPNKGKIELTVVASIAKTPCFGKCPVFEVRIYSDGRAVYNGVRYTNRSGIYEATVPETQMAQLKANSLKLKFYELADEYPVNGRRIPDLPSTITYLNWDGTEKKVSNNHDAPVELIEFEAMFLDWIEGLDWQAVPEYRR